MNKPVKPRRVIRMNPQKEEIPDLQMEADREWFINHPFATKYYRQPFECEVAEFAALEPGRKLKKMLVMKLDEDARVRQPVFEDM